MQPDNAYRLTYQDLEAIKNRATKQEYEKGSLIFSEGDAADEMYVIESGRVSIVIQEFARQESICSLGPGEYFGEMAFFAGDRRSASVVAMEKTILHCIGRDAFLGIYQSDKSIANKIDQVLAQRNRELVDRETLIDRQGEKTNRLHIGIKGDPSLRESAFTRDRYESPADQYLPMLQATLYDLLINRCAYEVSIHFNSGEVHVRTVFGPLMEGIHQVAKLANKGYVERHFQVLGYEEKANIVRRIYGFLSQDSSLRALPETARERLLADFENWRPINPAGIVRVLSKLSLLRKLQNFYIRNFTISTLRDVIRMQFNCDGVHIISAEQFESFLEDNIPMDDLVTYGPSNSRRSSQRRSRGDHDSGNAMSLCERRTPPGRRREDWDARIKSMSAS